MLRNESPLFGLNYSKSFSENFDFDIYEGLWLAKSSKLNSYIFYWALDDGIGDWFYFFNSGWAPLGSKIGIDKLFVKFLGLYYTTFD